MCSVLVFILSFAAGGLVGYFLGRFSAAPKSMVAQWRAPKRAEGAVDVRVGDVREFEAEGYLIQAEVLSKYTRRGVGLVRYRMWRDDESPERAMESESSAEKFMRVYDRLVCRAQEEGKKI